MSHYLFADHRAIHRRSLRRIVKLVGVLIVALAVAPLLTRMGPGVRVTTAPDIGGRSAAWPAAVTSSAPTSVAKGFEPRTVGRSVQGRPIKMWSFGTGSRRVLLIGGIHGNEYGSGLASRLVAYFTAHPSAVPHGSKIDIVPCANPDGTAAHRRTNAHGVDINRNFPVAWSIHGARSGESPGVRPASEPETRVIMALLHEGRYCRAIALHSAGGLVDYDGPGGARLASRIARAARSRVVHLATLRTYTGSLGRYAPARYAIPTITWELQSASLGPHVIAGVQAAAR